MGEYLHTFKPFTYIHIPKTAGTSIQRSRLVSIQNWNNHEIARNIKNLNKCFSFAFIRNPYDKVYSSYNYHINGSHLENSKKDWVKNKYPTFEEFILNYDQSKKLSTNHFEITQKQYITDSNGEVIVDYIGSFYKINEEFEKIQDLNPYFPGVFKLKVENKTHKPIINITDEMANIIYNNWREDFEFFNINKETYK